MDIEEDNKIHITRFLNHPPHPAYIAGFIDGNGCIFIRKIRDGYQSGICITQSRTNILRIIQMHYGGSITTSANRNNKKNIMTDALTFDVHTKRNEYNLYIRSGDYDVILNCIDEFLIVKYSQLKCLQRFSNLVHTRNNDLKEELYNQCLQLKTEKVVDLGLFSRINEGYIAGLFDAEGCIYISARLDDYRISICQKNFPALISYIREFLGYGNISETYRFVIYNKVDCLRFINMTKPYCIVKYNQLCAFETYLNTTMVDEKRQMYNICNQEKHQVENYTPV